MRLAAQVKMGYYPAPETVTDLISHWLTPPEDRPWRLLDPCAGKGEAAAQLAQSVGGDVETLGDFMEDVGDEIANVILRQRPLYDLNPTDAEWAAVSRLGLKRAPLPGQKSPGLLDVQKHVAIALARGCKRRTNALIQAEMGAGKSSMALATIDLLNAYPALVIAPPHLITDEQWFQEAQDVIPGVAIRELRRIGRQGDVEVNDVEQFRQDYENGLLGEKAIAFVASTSCGMKGGSEMDALDSRNYRGWDYATRWYPCS